MTTWGNATPLGVKLHDRVTSQDGGSLRTGYVCSTPASPFSDGYYAVSVAVYQAQPRVHPGQLVSVIRGAAQ